jgi:hypothetical protein
MHRHTHTHILILGCRRLFPLDAAKVKNERSYGRTFPPFAFTVWQSVTGVALPHIDDTEEMRNE